MQAVNYYVVVHDIKDTNVKVAGLELTEKLNEDNRYNKAKIISVGNLVEGVKVIGVKTLMNKLPLTASNLYSKNLFSFIRNLYSKEKKNFNINLEDEIISKTLIKGI